MISGATITKNGNGCGSSSAGGTGSSCVSPANLASTRGERVNAWASCDKPSFACPAVGCVRFTTCSIELPIPMRSPTARVALGTVMPSTSKPLAELRSITVSAPGSTSSLAWRFDTSGSDRGTSMPVPRPSSAPASVTVYRLPRSCPCTTSNSALHGPLLTEAGWLLSNSSSATVRPDSIAVSPKILRGAITS